MRLRNSLLASSSASSSSPRSEAEPGSAPKRVIVRLVGMVCAAEVATAVLSAGVIVAGGHRAWWSAWAAALIVNVLAAVVSLAPLAPGLFAGGRLAAYGYLVGAAIRVLVVLAGGMMAVMVVRTPAAPTLLLLVPFYFAQLLAEAVVLSRAFWPARQDSRVG